MPGRIPDRLLQVSPLRNVDPVHLFGSRGTAPRSTIPLAATSSGLRFLVAESEPPEAREKRRGSVGRSSADIYLDILGLLAPGAICHRIRPADADCELPSGETLAGYDAIFLTGSPLALYEETPETRRAVAFMRATLASGTPSFGSCAGLQLATVAAGGSVRPNRNRPEAGFARRIVPTNAGRGHPLRAGRPGHMGRPKHPLRRGRDPAEWCRPARRQPRDCGAGRRDPARGRHLLGGQYHPEIGLDEVTGALRRQADDLVEAGLARTRCEVEEKADLVEALHREPGRRDLDWRLGLDGQVIDEMKRRIEIANFIEVLTIPTRNRRR